MKRNYWPLFFIGIFSFTLGMIVWTIINATKANIEEDYSFQKKYQEVDENFNDMMHSNKMFSDKYDFILTINSKDFLLTVQDIMYSQRVLEKISKHKNLFKLDSNDLRVIVLDKKTKEKKNLEISLKITMSNSNKKDIILTNKDFKNLNNEYNTVFKIDEENNWNITGSFKVDGDIGYIYIKTNAS